MLFSVLSRANLNVQCRFIKEDVEQWPYISLVSATLVPRYSSTYCQINAVKLNKLKQKLDYGFNFNVDTCTLYMSSLLIKWLDICVNDVHVVDKVYKFLTHMLCTTFNSKIVVYKSVHSNGNTLHVNALRVKSRF